MTDAVGDQDGSGRHCRTVPARTRGRVAKFLRLVMIEHSVFALPFAYIAALTAMWQLTRSVHWWELVLITIAMVSARTVAMAATGSSTGTSTRSIRGPPDVSWSPARSICGPPGPARSSRWSIFLAAPPRCRGCAWCWRRSRSALLVLYSYGKRFTDFPQVLLGLAQFMAPVGAWLAVTNEVSWTSVRARPRGRHVDRRLRPHLLLPGRRGRPAHRLAVVPGSVRRPGSATAVVVRARRDVRALRVVRCRRWARMAGGGSGLALTAGVLVYEHRIVRPDDLSRVNRAFFTANGVIGIGLFVFALADLIAQGLRW